jgi:PAS domain S-box-containing protein
MGNWTWDASSDLVTLPDRAAEILGVLPDTQVTWRSMLKWLHPSDSARAAAAVRKAAETGGQYDVEYRITRAGENTPIWVAAKGRATYEPDGTLTGMTGVMQDITDRKHAEERQQLLIRELHHRVKNTLATVQAIVSSTARTASSIDDFYKGFVGRIVSLAQTHNLLTDDQWQKASLEELLRNELGPYEDKDRTRVILEGPVVEFPSVAAVPIGMAIHELTTNAAKHGAFANSEGWVEARWTVTQGSEEPVLNLIWTERGGPMVRRPQRHGFGSRLLQRVLASQLQASVQVDYDEIGIRCMIRMPMPSETALLNPVS